MKDDAVLILTEPLLNIDKDTKFYIQDEYIVDEDETVYLLYNKYKNLFTDEKK